MNKFFNIPISLCLLLILVLSCEPDPAETYLVTVMGNPQDGGTVTGGGLFSAQTQITVSATPAGGYLFVNWTEEGDTVTTEADYTFVVRSDRTLTANFEHKTYPEPDYGQMTDPRDNQTYQTVTIGDQEWMAQNLNYATENSWCYKDDPQNCQIYGRLYDWESSIHACPPGWHLPGDTEWNLLADYLGGADIAGGRMKSTGTVEDGTGLWNAPNTDATNSSGFSGHPAGRRYSDGEFYGLGIDGYWWSTAEHHYEFAFPRILRYFNGTLYRSISNKQFASSVRCIKNSQY